MKFAENEKHRYQWDFNVKLQCDDYPAGREFQFGSPVFDETFVTQLGDDKSVVIPNELFQHACPIDAYAMDSTGSYVTQSLRIWVHRKTKPEDYVFTPEEVKRWKQLEQRIDALEKDGATADHTKLTNRDAPDQHPISAIAGLEAALDEAKKPEIFTLTITTTYDDDWNATITADHTYAEVLAEIKKGNVVVAKEPLNDWCLYYTLSTGSYTKMLGRSEAIMFYSVAESTGAYAGWWYSVNFIALLENDTVKRGSLSTPKFDDELMNIDGRYAKHGLLRGGNCKVGFASSSDYVAPKALRIDVTVYKDGDTSVSTSLDWKTEFLSYLYEGGFACVHYTNWNLSDSTPRLFMPVKICHFPTSIKDDDVLGVYCRVSDDSTKLEYISIKGNQTFEYSEMSLGGGSGLTDEQAVAIAANTAARHTHDNKTVLDDITSEKIAEWDGKQPAGDYLTSETDPTVPEWAKQPKKPTYTAAEVGALPSNTVFVTDVQVDGESVVQDGVAEMPLIGAKPGLISYRSGYGLQQIADYLLVEPATKRNIDERNAAHSPLCMTENLDYAVKTAMSAPIADTAGLVDGVYHYPAWTDAEQKTARERLGIGDWEQLFDVTLEADVIQYVHQFQTPIKVKRLLFVVDAPVSELTTGQEVYIFWNEKNRYSVPIALGWQSGTTEHASRWYTLIDIVEDYSISHNYGMLLDTASWFVNKNNYMKPSTTSYASNMVTEELQYLCMQCVEQLKNITAGTRIRLYGVKA